MTADDEEEDDDDDDDELEEESPVAKGADSVGWLPSTEETLPSSESSVREDAEILPLFPLGQLVYTPHSEHVLNIFEPRYRQMYNDILMNGSRRFVVSMSHPSESGQFAKVGVLFELKDLKEVSEQTADQIKYICKHRVSGRVLLHRIVNPEAWSSRDTYLRVEGTVVAADLQDDALVVQQQQEGKDDDDDDDDEEDQAAEKKSMAAIEAVRKAARSVISSALGSSAAVADTPEEAALKKSFAALVELQHLLGEDVRFMKSAIPTLAVKPGGGEDGLWVTIRIWQSYIQQRLLAREAEMQKEFQEKLVEFLTKEKGMSKNELPSAIGFSDLSPELKKEMQELQKRMASELQPLVLESTMAMQKILEAMEHVDRVVLLRRFIELERKRLEVRKALRGMAAMEEAAEPTTTTATSPSLSPTEGEQDDPFLKSIDLDDPEAFQ